MVFDPFETSDPRTSKRRRWLLLLLILILFVATFIGGFFLGKSQESDSKVSPTKPKPQGYSASKFHKMMQDTMKASNIEENLRGFTKMPHLAGTPESNKHTKEFIFKKWSNALGPGMVELKKYNVMLSYPKTPGTISIFNTLTNQSLLVSDSNESRLWPDENVPNVVPPFNAFSAAKDVKGKLVYVNYALVSDFRKLEQLNISCKGKILLAKYGRGFRGNKVELAMAAGALGMILYTDPANYASGDSTYPKSWWMPPDGVQRGTVMDGEGDPLTPGYPSTDDMYRINANLTDLPNIPVQPISYQDALPLLKQLDGTAIPADWKGWQGGLNVTYRLTMSPSNKNLIHLNVNTSRERRDIYDVVATIKGSVEPDRIVIIGNHHDAWVMGAADPSSGSATLMEVIRVMGVALKKGWKPRRTIMICNWDAEEFGLIGSIEWTEDHAKMLEGKAVAYLNSDTAVSGNWSIDIKASDQLAHMVFDTAKKVKDPDNPSITVFENWRKSLPDQNQPIYPRVRAAGAGSDHRTFHARYGIPIVDIRYTYNWADYNFASSYPVYHSVHDSFHWMKTFVDPDFSHHLTLGRVWGGMAMELADQILLPFNFTRLSGKLTQCAQSLQKKYDNQFKTRGISLDVLKSHIRNFSIAATSFHQELASLDPNNVLKIRMANDQMMQVERSFIEPVGLPGRTYVKNVVFAPSEHDQYTAACFPGVLDAIYLVIQNKKEDWNPVRKALSLVTYHIGQAAGSLRQF